MKTRKTIIIAIFLVSISFLVLVLTMALVRREGDWLIKENTISSAGMQGPTVPTNPLIWNGNEYGIVWMGEWSGNTKLYFARANSDGNKIGDDVHISEDINEGGDPSLVWTGTEYGVTWSGFPDSPYTPPQIYFVRLDSNGNKIGNNVRISEIGDGAHNSSLVWTGTEYGVAWDGWSIFDVNNLYFARIDSDGNKIGDDVRILPDNEYRRARDPSLVWTGTEYGIAWTAAFFLDPGLTDSEIYFARLDSDGNRIGSVRNISSNSEDDTRASLVWTGTEYGVAWQNRDSESNYAIYFTRIDANGNRIGSNERIATIPDNPLTPSLCWTGTEYGVAWTSWDWVDKLDRNGIYFTRIDASGNKIGDDVRITEGVYSNVFGNPYIVGAGTKYGITWSEPNGLYDIKLTILSPLIRGSYPSLYQNRMVYQKLRWWGSRNIRMYDFIEERETWITFSFNNQSHPQIYGDIVVWQERGGGADDSDIYMHNIPTGEEQLVAGGTENQADPQVYGDYITWGIDPEGGLRDIGIYNIRTGETRRLSDWFDLSNQSFDRLLHLEPTYCIVGNTLVFSINQYPRRADVHLLDLTTPVPTDERDRYGALIENITGDYRDSQVYAFNGERVIYSEDLALDENYLVQPDRESLKAYNLITEERISLTTEIDGTYIASNNPISGHRLVYQEEIRASGDTARQGLWLYDFNIHTNSSTLLDSSVTSTNTKGFDIWGNRIVYSIDGAIMIINLAANTRRGEDVNVGLGNGISIEFSNVTRKGETILERSTTNLGGDIEGQFRLASGEINLFYNISTSAGYEGDIYITINYVQALDIGDAYAESLVLYHWDTERAPASWDALERTDINTVANTITFVTPRLSPFVLGYPNHPNHPPVITPIPPKTVNVGDTLRFTVSATDPDGDSVFVEIITLPNGASFDGSIFNLVPVRAGVYNVIFTATDGYLSTTTMVTITVLAGPEIIFPVEETRVSGVVNIVVSAQSLSKPYIAIFYVNNKYKGISRDVRKNKTFTYTWDTRKEKGKGKVFNLHAKVYDLVKRKWYNTKKVRVIRYYPASFS